MALAYFINRKKNTCVVTLQGAISISDAPILEACLKEATAESTRYLIVHLAAVKSVEPGVSRALTLFQQGLRTKSKLFICDLVPEVEKVLKAAGVVRDAEIFPDLMTCLQAIISTERG